MSTTHRKRRMMPSQQSRRVRRQRRSEPAEPEAEIVETGAEVVDLTCESSEPVVVDLTNNDSVEIVDEDLLKSLLTAGLPQEQLAAPFAWTVTQRLSKVGGLSSRLNVVMSSAASVSGTVSKIHTRVQPAERN
ncbi:RING finger protein 4 isoform X4 [Carcharodon carcharias]|uniref:RING finger protein 4 isoform X4 n=1 Tax=Carcharodon carcharias TaxID=13397 RepID=UPI001B7E0D72|nr:RING finger protein 4 isoform X4 [Carcharodon carcharias]